MTHPRMIEPRVDEAVDLAEKIDAVISENVEEETLIEDITCAVLLALATIMTHSGMDEEEGTSFVRRALPQAFRCAKTAKRAIN
jgi:hypothetical protein